MSKLPIGIRYCSRVGHFGASHKGLLPSLSNFRRKSRRRKSNALRKKAFVLRAGVPREL